MLLLFVLQVVIFSNNILSAQKLKPSEVPADVTQTLEFQYPYVKVTGWMKDGSNYVANIKDEGSAGKVYISSNGTWLRTTFNVPQTELPLAPVEKPAPKPVAAKDKETKPAPASSSSTKPATPTKPAQTKPATPAKPVAEKPAPKPENKKPEAKPEPKPKPVAAKVEEPKPQKEAKPEKPKKEKPEPVITDEQGNVALKPNVVPDIVKKSLTKKIMHPEELNWYLIDSMYVAKCLNTGKKTACYITPQGMWEKTLTALTEESVTGPMLKHLNDYYKGWRFKSAMKEQRADKNDKTMVEFYEKANYKSKLVTTALFDKTGKLIRTIDPDYELGGGKAGGGAEDDDLTKYYEKMNMSLENNDAHSVPENVVAVFKLKYPKVANVEWKEDDDMNYQAIYYSARGKEICVINNYGEIVETMVMGKLDNLSSTIQDNIKKDHKGFKVVEYYSVKKIAEKLNLYKVLIQNKKTGEEDVLWFNLSGRPVEY